MTLARLPNSTPSTSTRENTRLRPNLWSTITFLYLKSAGVLLCITGVAKLISASQKVAALEIPDPIMTFLPNKQIATIAGILELGIAIYVLQTRNTGKQLIAIAWISLLFVAYHFGLHMLHFHGLCPCLGNADKWLRLKDNTVNNITTCLIAYLFCGSLILLSRERFSQITGIYKRFPKR